MKTTRWSGSSILTCPSPARLWLIMLVSTVSRHHLDRSLRPAIIARHQFRAEGNRRHRLFEAPLAVLHPSRADGRDRRADGRRAPLRRRISPPPRRARPTRRRRAPTEKLEAGKALIGAVADGSQPDPRSRSRQLLRDGTPSPSGYPGSSTAAVALIKAAAEPVGEKSAPRPHRVRREPPRHQRRRRRRLPERRDEEQRPGADEGRPVEVGDEPQGVEATRLLRAAWPCSTAERRAISASPRCNCSRRSTRPGRRPTRNWHGCLRARAQGFLPQADHEPASRGAFALSGLVAVTDHIARPSRRASGGWSAS